MIPSGIPPGIPLGVPERIQPVNLFDIPHRNPSEISTGDASEIPSVIPLGIAPGISPGILSGIPSGFFLELFFGLLLEFHI